MHSDVTYKSKQFLFVLIKLSIVVAAFYFIYSKITQNENLEFNQFISFLKENNIFSTNAIVFLILLSSFNWCFEILKWQYLVATVKRISFKSALEQSLGGLTASLITPNRIGDYGAKAIYYTKPYRTKIVVLNLLGNMAQMTMTLLFGIIGILVFIHRYSIGINYYKTVLIGILICSLGGLAIVLFKQKRFKIKGISFSLHIDFIKSIALKTHLLNLSLALIRYALFSFQFYYLLKVFGIDIAYFEAMIFISSMYLLASIVPSLSMFDVVIKGSVAVFLFGYMDVNELIVLSITTIMWLLNFMVPSILGSYFVLRFKLPKSAVSC